jgi:hypothetical protein
MAHHQSVSSAARHLESTLSAAVHSLKEREKERHHQKKRQGRLASEKERRKRGIVAKNLPHLERGVAALARLVQTPQMRDLAALYSKASETLWGEQRSGIEFYSAWRPSGDAWDFKGVKTGATRDVRILLLEDSLKLEGGAFYVPQFYLDERISFSDIGSGKYRPLFERLAVLVYPRSQLGFFVLNQDQRKHCWSPEGIIAQVLYDCSYPGKLQKYLKISMERIMKK